LILGRPVGRWATSRPNLSGAPNDLPQVLLNCIHILSHHVIGPQVKRNGPYLAYSQAPQHLLHQPRLEVPALVAVQLFRGPEAAGKVGHWGIRQGRCLLARDSVKLRPLGEVVRKNQEVSVPSLALRKESCDV
jgi:hypothetical protein